MEEVCKMERLVGTISRGIRCPIFRPGDDLAQIVTDSVLAAAESDGFAMRDRDVIGITESVVARVQGNFASVDDIAIDVKNKLGGGTVGVIFPILSRNAYDLPQRYCKACKNHSFALPPSDEAAMNLSLLTKVMKPASTPIPMSFLLKISRTFRRNSHPLQALTM